MGGDLRNKKNRLLSELADIDLTQDSRHLTEDELMVRAIVLVELEELAKIEEYRAETEVQDLMVETKRQQYLVFPEDGYCS